MAGKNVISDDEGIIFAHNFLAICWGNLKSYHMLDFDVWFCLCFFRGICFLADEVGIEEEERDEEPYGEQGGDRDDDEDEEEDGRMCFQSIFLWYLCLRFLSLSSRV